MKRVSITPRPDWQDRLDKLGFYYHSVDGNYWQENACYVFNMSQIDAIETATYELHEMYMQAVAHVVKQGSYRRLGIDRQTATLIEQSWQRQEPCLYGRFDLSYHPQNLGSTATPKLLEYNADTPTALFEASVAQWYWLVEQQPHILPPDADQFNSIHERLLIEWQSVASYYARHAYQNHQSPIQPDEQAYQDFLQQFTMYFTAIGESIEDFTTTRYLQDTAIQAGLTTEFIDIADIGWDEQHQQFIDLNNLPIEHIFKLYPWEWLAEEGFFQHLVTQSNMKHTSVQQGFSHHAHQYTHWLEPAWKGLMSNKAMLAVLWEMFPHHPNLLPCYFASDNTKRHKLDKTNVVKKPFFSREGANVALTHQGKLIKTDGDYGKTLLDNQQGHREQETSEQNQARQNKKEQNKQGQNNKEQNEEQGYVYQACHPLPKFTKPRVRPNSKSEASCLQTQTELTDCYAVIGSWVIGHCSAGIGIREDNSLITKDSSLFVPHVIID